MTRGSNSWALLTILGDRNPRLHKLVVINDFDVDEAWAIIIGRE